MSPTGRSFEDWAETRVGQAILFWGALELLLRTLDALTKSDLLVMLRGSLAPELEFLGHPRAALVLVSLASALLWWANRPKKPTRSILDTPDQPEPKNHSAIEVTALPLFLAFVCGLSFASFEWSSPSHGRLAHLSTPAPIKNLPGKLERGLQATARTARINPSAALSAASGSPKEAERLVQSLPPLTPALDQESEGANIEGNENPAALNPFDLHAPGGASSPEREQAAPKPAPGVGKLEARRKALDRIEQARNRKDWQSLASLCEGAIAGSPQWLTPYLFAGEAYASLGQIDLAIQRLEYVQRNGARNPDNELAVEQAARLRESIRQQYGR